MTDRLSILIVHGRGRKPGEEAYRDIAFDAIRSGIARDFPDCLDAFDAVRLEFVYYGDLTNALLDGDGVPYDAALDIGDRRNALTALKAITARKRFSIRDYDRLAGKTALKEFAADVLSPVARLSGLGMWLLRRVSEDFAEYLDQGSEYATEVRRRVRDKLMELFDSDERIMVIAHGTGSVIVYDALWEMSHEPGLQERVGNEKLDQWVTLGTPLGSPLIQKRLLGASQRKKLRFPSNVITWQNLSAEDDYTCYDNTVADDFKGMMKDRLVSQVKDYRIFNLAVRYGRSNPHSSVGYFIHPRLSKVINDWINSNG